MVSLIIDLQKDILEDNDNKSIFTKALMISKELRFTKFNEWLNLELNGYNDLDKIPPYRKLECELRMDYVHINRYPFPNIPGSTEKLRKVSVHQSIYELINMCKSNEDEIWFKLDFKQENELKKYLENVTDIYRVCPIFKLETIIDHVKNEIMNWCSRLKEIDIYGEDYSFTDKEIEKAKTINYNIVLNNPKIHIGDNTLISCKQDILVNLSEIKNVLKENDINKEQLTEIKDQIVIIEQELEKDNPNVDEMENASKHMRDIITKVMTGAIADLLLQYINHLIQILLTIQVD